MATSQMSEVIQHLRRTTLLRAGAGLTDGQLLEDYISRRDEAALAALVWRHGPMVWGVCRRVLSNYHDAEDSFQATFLVLVRKAASIASRELLANWLYGVAHQTALKARATVAKRKVRERQVAEMPEAGIAAQDLWSDLQPLLDKELSHLPDKYRVAIVLCDLEGKTRKETARQLGVPEGTVAGWLARARAMLAKRLTRHGLAVSSGVLAAVLSQNVASASVPISVVFSTIKVASLLAAGQAATGVISVKIAALLEGMLRTMLLTKLKIATALLLAVVAVVGAGGLLYSTQAAEPTKDQKADALRKSEQEKLQGTWRQVSCEGKEGKLPEEVFKDTLVVIKGETMTVTAGEKGGYELTFKLDKGTKFKTIDETLVKPEKGDKPYLGIYSLEGDTLTFCFSDPGEKRPTEFTGKLGSGWTLTVFKRERAKK